MLRSMQEILGYQLEATDGGIGKVKDFYFDDHEWALRYMVADPGTWLSGRKVLLSPAAFGLPDWSARIVPVSLSKQQIEEAPSINTDQPVSRQEEHALAGYFGWPIYWAPGSMATYGMIPPQAGMPIHNPGVADPQPDEQQYDLHLRSFEEIRGYHIHASDGEIGHVEDCIVQTDEWVIRYFVVDTRNWLPGRKVLVSPVWIDRLSYAHHEVFIKLPRQSIKDSPEFDPSAPVTRTYEARLSDYYGVPRYWQG